MDDLTDDEILAFRDLTEFMAGAAQIATGSYGSGGEAPAESVARARANVAAWLTEYPGLRDALDPYIQRIRGERARYAQTSKGRRGS